MGDVLKSLEHSGDDSPLVSLRDRCCRQRQVLPIGLEQIYTSLGVHHLQLGDSDVDDVKLDRVIDGPATTLGQR